jgi:hypothetical protein
MYEACSYYLRQILTSGSSHLKYLPPNVGPGARSIAGAPPPTTNGNNQPQTSTPPPPQLCHLEPPRGASLHFATTTIKSHKVRQLLLGESQNNGPNTRPRSSRATRSHPSRAGSSRRVRAPGRQHEQSTYTCPRAPRQQRTRSD